MSHGTAIFKCISASASHAEEHALQVRKALKVMGYDTHAVSRTERAVLPARRGKPRRSRNKKAR